MTREKKLVLLVMVLLLVFVVTTRFFYTTEKTSSLEENKDSSLGVNNKEENLPHAQEETYTPAVPPVKNTTFTSPQKEIVNPVGNYRYQSFTVAATAQGFEPSTIIVRQGDMISIQFIPKDGDYSFSIPSLGIHVLSEQGRASVANFSAVTPGTFRFTCGEKCPSSGIKKGSLVVMPK